MKYTTSTIDYTGCHPVIAEHLKRGEAIECLVWSNSAFSKKVVGVVTGYEVDGEYPYRIAPTGNSRYAEPIPRKVRRIMPPERAIPVLIADGWVFGDSGDLVGYGNCVVTTMFKLMGKPLSDPKTFGWVWPPCIIEEVEDDE